jgi:broad specificity phosphatase PhoE
MRLFLVRHGETVDNVAGLFAGSRDSALTVHGVLQAQRLASHLAETVFVTHIFSSNLQRAIRTAEIVQADQAALRPSSHVLPVVQLRELREKHFGSGEGVKFGSAARVGEKKEHVGAETVEQMKVRVGRFLDDHLAPLWTGASRTEVTPCVVVVAHGIILGVLFKALCKRFPSDAIKLSAASPQASRSSGGPGSALNPAWSNTGFLEAVVAGPMSQTPRSAPSYQLLVEHINCVDHLKGLKKTRGGIGSAQFDDKQTTIDSFFGLVKKRKLDDVTK